MVGYYWLRNTALAPTPEIRTEIEETIKEIKTFAADDLHLRVLHDDEPADDQFFVRRLEYWRLTQNMAEPSFEDRTDVPNVAWSDVVRFIRQLSHDLRNHLNAIELQSAYISELERDDGLKGEIKRLREMISGLTSALQSLSKAVSAVKPNPISYPSADFVEDLRKKIIRDFSGENAEITWNVQLGDATLNVDPQLLQETLTELFANAFRHNRGKGPLVATAKIDNNQFLFTLEEPKARFDLPTDNWGHEPLRTISQGHYGLGLNRVRIIVEAHGGELYAQHNPENSMLITRLSLPLEGERRMSGC